MRRHLTAAAALAVAAAAPLAAQSVEMPAGEPAAADKAEMARERDMGGMGNHADRLYSFTQIQADYSRQSSEDVINWDAEGWLGGDRHKLWWKSEGERNGPRLEQAEFQALYSRNVWTFFDLQGGIRYDVQPDRRGYAVVGIQGLAPYLLETELHAFIGFKGDVSLRFKQSFDLLLTNRLIAQPIVETDFYLNDVPERRIGSGFSIIETGVQTRYEFSRKFAPYVSAMYERRLGASARLARAADEDVGGWSIRGGLRLWF